MWSRSMSPLGKPLLIDLCCGLGGWSQPFIDRGWRAVGFDIKRFDYPGELVIQDVRTIDGRNLRGARLIVASPPCEEFSRFQMPWTRAKNPPEPDLSIVDACFRIAREAHAPVILENVRAAREWLGMATMHWGPFYLWGDGVPALLPSLSYRLKESYSSSERAKRAQIPRVLADWIAEVAA